MSRTDDLARALEVKAEDEQLFARCVNRLLGDTFVLREFDRDDYYFLRRYQEQVTAYLDLAGWDLIHDPLGNVYGVVNRFGANRRSLKRLESELLLVLALAYLEQRAQLQLADTPLINMADLRQKYRTLLGETGRLTQTGLRDALATLRRYRLIEPSNGRRLNPQSPDQAILLLPTLRLALDVERVEEAAALLDKYKQSAADEEDAED